MLAISDFNALHSRKHNEEVQLYAFDILVLGGDDLRKLPLHLRKTNFHSSWRVAPMASQLRRSNEARSLRLFRHACPIGLEGMVCKHRDSPYRAGRQPHWIKVKNRKHPSLDRAKDGNW